MPKLLVDNTEIMADQGTSLLKACLSNGIYIPHLCFMEEMEHPSASCRLCFIQIEGENGPVPSCTVPVRGGMVVKTDTPEVRRLRKSAFGLLMSVHHIIPKCPAKKTCELIKIAKFLGMSLKTRSLPLLLKETGTDTSHPIFDLHLNRCVLCKKCINICRIRHGWSQWIFAKRGFDMVVGYYGQCETSALPCADCMACVEICPVGAITLKSR